MVAYTDSGGLCKLLGVEMTTPFELCGSVSQGISHLWQSRFKRSVTVWFTVTTWLYKGIGLVLGNIITVTHEIFVPHPPLLDT